MNNKIIGKLLSVVVTVAVTAASYLAGQICGEKMEASKPCLPIPDAQIVVSEIADEGGNCFFDTEDKIFPLTDISDRSAELAAYEDKGGKLFRDFSTKINGCKVTAMRGSDSAAVRNIFSDIGKLDCNMINTIETIIITPESLADKFSVSLKDGQFVRGVSNGYIIYLNDLAYRNSTLIHEIFHNIDYYAGDKNGPFRYSEDYAEFYEEYVVPNDYPPYGCFYISEYKPEEYFAGMGQVWYMAPEWLREKDPVVYEFYESHFGEIFKSRCTDWELAFLDYNKLTKEWAEEGTQITPLTEEGK